MSKNDLYDILGDDDFHVSETPILYPQSVEFYLNRGYIEVGILFLNHQQSRQQ